MRPITKSRFKPVSYVYNPHGDAKDELIDTIGGYCSYCERPGYSSALDVEHIRDKDTHPQRKHLWRNFLIGCKNCNPVKSTKSILNMYFPTVNNTFEIFIYDQLGQVTVNTALLTTNAERDRAQMLIDLVGLDRRPGHPQFSKKDKRWSDRKDAYLLAEKYLPKYKAGDIDVDTIIDLAKAKGFWSAWMTVFSTEHHVTSRLIQDFPGTRL
ncbi:HNH endonuclease [Shewanella vaxholmensis]|uniref:HNH endonuclease n=1 Tax=Shewanella vaxholmensis TaxID=3063535 RepID=UPI0028902706|nr:HNH endonuclease [Shewanella sp. SP1S1-4]MDT3306257.1 HNH endonuclease [Shewanella sp. SP1S1-4]